MGDKMYWIWIMIFLCICTFTDIKKRNVCGWLCILNIVAAIMLHTIFRDISGKSLIEGAIIGGDISNNQRGYKGENRIR